MKRFKFYNQLDKEGQMMFDSIIEFGMLIGIVAGSLLLIAYFIVL